VLVCSSRSHFKDLVSGNEGHLDSPFLDLLSGNEGHSDLVSKNEGHSDLNSGEKLRKMYLSVRHAPILRT